MVDRVTAVFRKSMVKLKDHEDRHGRLDTYTGFCDHLNDGAIECILEQFFDNEPNHYSEFPDTDEPSETVEAEPEVNDEFLTQLCAEFRKEIAAYTDKEHFNKYCKYLMDGYLDDLLNSEYEDQEPSSQETEEPSSQGTEE